MLKNLIVVVAPSNNQNCLFDSLKEAWMEYVLRDNSTDLSKCQRRFFTKVWRKCMIGIFHFLGILFLRCQPMHFPCIFCRIVCLRIYQLTLYNFGWYKKLLFPNFVFIFASTDLLQNNKEKYHIHHKLYDSYIHTQDTKRTTSRHY